MPEARQFAEHVFLTRTLDEFLDGLDRALAQSGDRQAAARRQAAVAAHSWEARFAAVEQILAARLDGLPAQPARTESSESAVASGLDARRTV
jgi:hypothetical protein